MPAQSLLDFEPLPLLAQDFPDFDKVHVGADEVDG
jgi:hypothetical protein